MNFTMMPSKQLDSVGDLQLLTECLALCEKEISVSSLLDRNQVKLPFLHQRLLTLQDSLQQKVAQSSGSTMKNKEAKLCLDAYKQALAYLKQSCSPTLINIKLPLTVTVDNTLKSSIPPTSIEDRLNNFARSLSQPLLYLIKLTKSKDSLTTAKTSDLGQFIFGLENLQKHTVLLLEYVKLMRQEKANDG